MLTYWSMVSLILGACIGSFLNVVIYRWPRDLSIRRPKRSFCPACNTPIAWYDNIPIISYLVLGGRCRHCKSAISLQYPLVELATALVFLITYDAFFVARMRLGIGWLQADWLMLIAHWGLWAGMIVLAVMDLEAYLVDIRVTWLIALAGAVGHLFWTPASSVGWIRPGPELSLFSTAVAVGLLIGACLFLWRKSPLPPEPLPEDTPQTPAIKPGGIGSRGWLAVAISVAFVGVYLALIVATGRSEPAADRFVEYHQTMHSWLNTPPELQGERPRLLPLDLTTIRLLGGMVFLFLALALLASQPQPDADAEIVEEIDAGAAHARRLALAELKLLSPAIMLGLGVLIPLFMLSGTSEWAYDILHYSVAGQWQPIWGLATALCGWVVGGMVGWLTRVVFTLIFGKEALGMGDVHILAAAGAVAGWPVAFMGFFLASMLSLLAILVIMLRRQSRALPYGPWLALAFFLVAVFQDDLLVYLGMRLPGQ